MMLSSAIDLEQYPINQPKSQAYQSMLTDLRNKLAQDGCAVLRGFVRQDALPEFIAEADHVSHKGHRSFSRTNAYFTQDDPSLPSSHPLRQFFDRSNAFIPADNLPPDGPMRGLYEWAPFMPFVREALNESEDKFFRYDDPLADVIINQTEEGGGFPWHFDTNNYTVTLAIQNGNSGGDFEYAPNLRTSESENYDDVQAVLEGRSDAVRTLVLQPGDLQIFKGRYSLHRVTPVKGGRKRYVGIFSFVEKEGMCGGVERTKQLYGRVLPIHYERAGLRSDALVD